MKLIDLNNWAYAELRYYLWPVKEKNQSKDKKIICDNQSIFTSMNNDISQVPWEDWGVNIIIDSSGVLKNTLKAEKF